MSAALDRDKASDAADEGIQRARAASKVRADLARGLVQARGALRKATTSNARRVNTERVRVLQRRYDASIKEEQKALSQART